jgi:hypothetical protein
MSPEIINELETFCISKKLVGKAESDWFDIIIGPAVFCIERRPYYCDRGRFTLKAFSNDGTKFYIDHSDGFPRYYFVLENLLSELEQYIIFNREKLR